MESVQQGLLAALGHGDADPVAQWSRTLGFPSLSSSARLSTASRQSHPRAHRRLCLRCASLVVSGPSVPPDIRAADDRCLDAEHDLLRPRRRLRHVEEIEAWLIERGIVEADDAEPDAPIDSSCSPEQHEAQARAEAAAKGASGKIVFLE